MFFKLSVLASRLWTLMSIIYRSKQGNGIRVTCTCVWERKTSVWALLNSVTQPGAAEGLWSARFPAKQYRNVVKKNQWQGWSEKAGRDCPVQPEPNLSENNCYVNIFFILLIKSTGQKQPSENTRVSRYIILASTAVFPVFCFVLLSFGYFFFFFW